MNLFNSNNEELNTDSRFLSNNEVNLFCRTITSACPCALSLVAGFLFSFVDYPFIFQVLFGLVIVWLVIIYI